VRQQRLREHETGHPAVEPLRGYLASKSSVNWAAKSFLLGICLTSPAGSLLAKTKESVMAVSGERIGWSFYKSKLVKMGLKALQESSDKSKKPFFHPNC
jgi:hypothetical protein